jgi:uronate dehydrogenase
VFEAAAAAGVRRVVLMSSLTVYFDEPIPKRIDTQTPLQPRNHYAVTKLYGEQLAWLYAAQQKLSVVCWRMGQPYPVDHFKLEHLAEPGARVCAVSSGDISRGVIAGLESDLPEDGRGGLHTGLRPTAGHAVANLVSASDVKPEYGYDLTAGLALGYVPGDRFTAAGPVPNDSEANA